MVIDLIRSYASILYLLSMVLGQSRISYKSAHEPGGASIVVPWVQWLVVRWMSSSPGSVRCTSASVAPQVRIQCRSRIEVAPGVRQPLTSSPRRNSTVRVCLVPHPVPLFVLTGLLSSTTSPVPMTPSTAKSAGLGFRVGCVLCEERGSPLSGPAVQAVQEIVCQSGNDLAPHPSQARSYHRQHPGSQGNWCRHSLDLNDL